MTPYTTTQIRERYLSLPESLREYIFSEEVAGMIRGCGTKNALTPTQVPTLAKIVGRVLMRFITPEKFTETLTAELKVLPEKATAIAEQVQREILAKIPKEGTPLAVPIAVKPIAPVAAVPQKAQTAENTQPKQNTNAVGTDEKNLRALFRISVGTTYTEDALREKFESLPAGLRQAIASVDTANAVQTIAKRYLLHVDQMGALSSETGLVLLGLTHPRDFTKNLSARLRISEARALEIAKSVSEAVLVKVKETLRGLHEEKHPETPVKKLSVLSAQAETALTAKWNTSEEKPEREEILRGVENPRTAVGPTGWRPATQNTPTPLPPSKPVVPPPPPTQVQKPKSILDEKLTQTVSLPREEKKYSVDPYREPIQ